MFYKDHHRGHSMGRGRYGEASYRNWDPGRAARSLLHHLGERGGWPGLGGSDREEERKGGLEQ